MKKLISVIASVMMIASLGVSSVTASADEGVAFEVTKVSTVGEVANGVLVNEETVSVPVIITKNQGSTAFLLEFNHDSAIEVTGISYTNSVYRKSGQFSWNINALCLLWSDNLCQDTLECGTVAELEFKVPAGTPVGQYEIAFTESEIQLTNSNFDAIEYTLTPGYIEVGAQVSENPEVTEAPVTTTVQPQVTEPPVNTTKAPVSTTKAPVTTTKAPVKATQPKATTTEKADVTTKKPAATTVVKAEVSTQKTEKNNSAVQTTKPAETIAVSEESVVQDSLNEIMVAESEENIITSEEATTTKAVAEENSKTSSKSATKVDKTSDSPSTGVASIIIPAALLVVSTGGVVVAAKSKKKK